MHLRRARVNQARQTIMDMLSPWFDFAAHSEGHTGQMGRTALWFIKTLQVPDAPL